MSNNFCSLHVDIINLHICILAYLHTCIFFIHGTISLSSIRDRNICHNKTGSIKEQKYILISFIFSIRQPILQSDINSALLQSSSGDRRREAVFNQTVNFTSSLNLHNSSRLIKQNFNYGLVRYFKIFINA